MVIVTVLWFIAGYSLSFGTSGAATNGFIGGLQAAFLNGVTPTTAHSLAPGLPEFLWIAYQLTFAIITPALIAGAFAERMKFSASILFFFLWHLIVYAPICHQVWGGGWMGGLGVLDFAGGAVVHVNAGVAGLVCALVLGPRQGFGRDNMAPHNLAFTAIGTGLLFVGWLGFNAGSACRRLQHHPRRLCRRHRLDRRGMDRPQEADPAGPAVRHRRRPRRHHPGRRLCRSQGRLHHRHRLGPGLLRRCRLAQARPEI
jgi:ammonia channel protein AmtB